jgi:arginase
MRKNCTFLGAATDLGQSKAGTELAPSWLRLKGSQAILARKFFNVTDLGDLTPIETPAVKGHDHPVISRYNRRLGETILNELNQDRMAITLGGDHSVAIGTLTASLMHNPDTKVVWVDAHADLNTPETSPSGNLHGMPLAFFFDLLKPGPTKDLFNWVPSLKPENLVYLGLRDVDEGEKRFIKELGITAFYADDIKKLGIDNVLNETVAQLCPQGNEDLHLSFDVDGLDPEFVPATGTPVPGGIDLLDGQQIVNTLMRKSNVISFDVVEVNPLLGIDAAALEKTAESTKALLEALPTWDAKETTLDKILFTPAD